MEYEGKKITKDELKKMVEEVFRREDKKDRKIDILKYASPQQRELVNKIFKEEVEKQLGESAFEELKKPLEVKDLKPYKRPKFNKEEEMKAFKKSFKNKQ